MHACWASYMYVGSCIYVEPDPPQLLKSADTLDLDGTRICVRKMENQQDQSGIYHAGLNCNQLFDKCLAQIVEPRTSSLIGESAFTIGRLARDHQARFQAWSSYLGVFAEQTICLDRRLSNSEDIRDMVMDLLHIIAVSLQHCQSVLESQVRTIAELLYSLIHDPNKRRW